MREIPGVPVFEKTAEKEDGVRLWHVNKFGLCPEVNEENEECLNRRWRLENSALRTLGGRSGSQRNWLEVRICVPVIRT